jgi:hypothetical protein
MDLTQSSGTINGTWAMTSGVKATGIITGTVDKTSFSGNVTYNLTNGASCSGSVSGAASAATTMTWTSPGLTGNCGLVGGNPVNVRFVLQRR